MSARSSQSYQLILKNHDANTGWSISYRKYILKITQPSQYRYAKLQFRFAVISGSPSSSFMIQTHCWSVREFCSLSEKRVLTRLRNLFTSGPVEYSHYYCGYFINELCMRIFCLSFELCTLKTMVHIIVPA